MKIKNIENGFVIRLEKGEKIIESLSQFVKDKEIPSGTLLGIGAINNTKLGAYHLHEKKYVDQTFCDEMELINLTGNISWFEGKPILHCHATIGDMDQKTYAGHLFEAETAVTVEIMLFANKTRIERKFDAEIGLNLLDL